MGTERILGVISAFLFLSTIFLLVQNAFLGSGLAATRANLDERNVQLDAANAEIARLNGTLIRTEAELGLAQEELDNTSLELRLTRMDLNETAEELEGTREELRETANLLNETMEEFLQLRMEIQNIEESINSSIQWFRDNSELPRTMNSFFYDVDSGCVERGRLRLACVPFLMEKELGFVYKSEFPDKLYSLVEMVHNNGGDCEDYALYLKAMLNRFRNAGADLQLEAWDAGDGRYIVYTEGDMGWYVEGSPHPLGTLQELNPYVICYTTAFTGSGFDGHCTVALSEKKVDTAAELGNLYGVETFEPQNGEYLGRIGEALRICGDGEAGCGTEIGSIIFVIADDDLYQFMDGEWKSYKLYGDEASGLGEKIDEVVGR
ncbi:MAG: hypothetical protein AB1657_00315 [Candidatus Micrarchaeota archaeon]